MPHHVCNGATLGCSFGLAPGTLAVLPLRRMLTRSQPAATVMDHQPLVNVMPFGACTTPSNPAVAAATAAALGVLTPMPCMPVTPAPWVPGTATVLEGGVPVLNSTSTLQCVWGGTIRVLAPGQMTELVP
ncbi:DUF4280 domain-containing protein [Pseudorhodoferax sp.]|uniref:DUF4280 domain-containing protein n=1 Tax=Pseudorhodoferax sp. TaxID=1993553 RepID=UPI0039E2A018